MSEGHTERLEAALDGKYLIERKLGEGGMATVYLAQDVKHERKVALKILKPELAAVIGAERFLSEIKTTAGLQHPHILALHDSGEASGYLYYVMPYIEGETLREKLDREKQLGVEESVRIARDVADALDYAHRQGVIHRDIKPGNILLHDGRPVVADFGIALAVSAAGGGRMTETGLSLGTPHYMSPEQASADRDLSARSDVYSLGCVLYEMLAGQPPHTGPSAQSILVHILTKDVTPLTELRHTVPPNVAATVAKAIEKLPADRFESAKQFMEALGDSAFTYAARTKSSTAPAVGAEAPQELEASNRRLRRMLVVATSLAVVFALALGWLQLRPEPNPEPGVPTRAEVTGLDLGPRGSTWRLAISREGRWIVAAGAEPGAGPALYIRPSDDMTWRRLPNTENAFNPTFGPDGEWVAFEQSGDILKVPIDGGPALPIVADGDEPNWGDDDTVVFTRDRDLYRVASSGGEAELLLATDSLSVSRPYLLPNGKGVVFSSTSRVVLFDIETGEVRELVAGGDNPRYAPTGHLVYRYEDDALMGVPFDVETLEVTGSPATVLPGLQVTGGGAGHFAFSETGTLVYGGSRVRGGANQLVSVSLDGSETPLLVRPGPYFFPRYSPSGEQLAYQNAEEIRLLDLTRGSGSNLQFSSGGGMVPTWSSSGEELYYRSAEPRGVPLVRRADSGDEARPLWSEFTGFVLDVAPGDSILVLTNAANDLLLAREGTGWEVEDLVVTPSAERNPAISPDGRWIAYQSFESGEDRIYVNSFPELTGRISVSPALGYDPRWSPDGSAIYYRSDDRLLRVGVTREPTFLVSAPTEVLDVSPYLFQTGGRVINWDLHPDGTRFVFVRSGEAGAGGTTFYVVTNWFEELRERMGEN